MICPVCGHENSDLATVCSSCGAPLQPDWDGTWESGDTSTDEETPDDTLHRDTPADAPAPTDADPSLTDVARSAGRFVSSRGRRLATLAHAHRVAFAIGCAVALAVVAMVVLLVVTVANAPSDGSLEADVSSRMPTFAYVGGTYGTDETIDVSSVTVTRKQATDLPAGASSDVTFGPKAYRLEAEVRYQGSSVTVTRSVAGVYVHDSGQWSLAGELEDQGTSYQATSGASQDAILAAMPQVLAAADGNPNGALATAYQNAQFAVVSDDFEQAPENDTSTDTLVIHAVRADTYSSLEADVTANLAFQNGKWGLRSASATSDALTPRYDRLEGSWTGSFIRTASTKTSCYGASAVPLQVTITDVGDSSTKSSMVTGTVSGLAHYHDAPAADEDADANDQRLDAVAFTGTISTDHSDVTDSNLNIDCTIPDATGGSVEFTLGFGTSQDEGVCTATVRTTHEYTETVLFVLPHDTSVTYTDTYRLSRASATE